MNCGHVFETGLIEVSPGVSGVSFQNCGVSCPRCGGLAEVGDGTYSNPAGTLRLDTGPLRTRAIINELKRLAEKSRANHLSTEEVLSELADISPDLAKKLRSIGPWPAVGLIILLFWLVKSFSLDLKIDVNWLIDEAWHMSHGDDPYQHVDSPPPQFPSISKPSGDSKKQHALKERAINNAGPNRSARRRAAAQARRGDRRLSAKSSSSQ